MSGQRVVIHQFHPAVSAGDAVTRQMFFIRESLLRAGIAGEIFTTEWDGVSREAARPLSRSELWNADLLLVHHSMGHPSIDDILRLEVPKALVYHNVTPPKFFLHDLRLAGLCRLGREQLKGYRGRVVAAFADSRFNAGELESLGFERPELLPLLDLKTPPGERRKRNGSPGLLLSVGRLVPHKNQAALIAALFYLKRFSKRPYRLVLAGAGESVYVDYLRLLAKQLGVERDVEMPGQVSEEALLSLYGRAEAFVSTSLYEGFGVSLVEAMRHELPVFALSRAAVGETLGNAGLRLPSEKPGEIAAFIDDTIGASDWPRTRKALLAGQRKRLLALEKEQSAEGLVRRLKARVNRLRRSPLRPGPRRGRSIRPARSLSFSAPA
jgi:glycosyltransferase involved in cell wall biosynthesis